MGTKISVDARLDAIFALQEYKREYSSYEEMRVVAKKKEKVIFNGRIKVIVGDYNIYHKVDIIWDDVNPNYHDIGLYGYYSTDYCHMEYTSGVLTIFDENGIEVIITK